MVKAEYGLAWYMFGIWFTTILLCILCIIVDWFIIFAARIVLIGLFTFFLSSTTKCQSQYPVLTTLKSKDNIVFQAFVSQSIYKQHLCNLLKNGDLPKSGLPVNNKSLECMRRYYFLNSRCNQWSNIS